jgi:hypothetical protein
MAFLAFALALSASGEPAVAHCGNCSLGDAPTKPVSFTCQNLGKADCEWKLGDLYYRHGFFAEAAQHCAAAVGFASSHNKAEQCLAAARRELERQRRERFDLRLLSIRHLIQLDALASAKTELSALKAFEAEETKTYGPLDADEELRLTEADSWLATARQQEWPNWISANFGLREWLPGVVTLASRCLLYGLFALLLWFFLWLVRFWIRAGLWFYMNLIRSVRWSVSSIADETKQLAAGALMDALNIYHNPLFQDLNTSSFLASPPGLTDSIDRIDPIGPSYAMWRNFLVDSEHRERVRAYLSDLIEKIDRNKFCRHTFKQVEAFEDINLKLGVIEGSLGAIFRNWRRWWTKGWPTVTGSVVFENIGEVSFASVRLICNWGQPFPWMRTEMPPDDADVELRQLISSERTMAVFASTEVDEFTDAVALASHRAAFRLLYRLAKRPAEPNLAITSASYRQGFRILQDVL